MIYLQSKIPFINYEYNYKAINDRTTIIGKFDTHEKTDNVRDRFFSSCNILLRTPDDGKCVTKL